MRKILWLVIVGILLAFAPMARADDSAELAAAAKKIVAVTGEIEQLYAKGAFDEALKKLLETFPAATRTPMQTVLLGNAVRKHDPKLAYDMHKLAAIAAPRSAVAQFEWAIDQQRAREWSGAAASYEAYDKLEPRFAPAYGLWAQCLIEQGKIKEACAMWQRSEAPGTHGSLQEFQRLVCEANWQVSPFRVRRELFAKAKGGDLESARKLVVLDADFPNNWWTRGVMPTYLAGDLEMLRGVRFTDSASIKEITDAGEVALASVRRRVDMTDFLKQKGYLFDAKGRLPKDPGALCVMITAALTRRTLTQEEAMDAWGETVLKAGKASKDVELLGVAMGIYAGSPEMIKIQQFGWDNTKDDRFAGSMIVMLFLSGELRAEDARLARALKEYPRNALIAGVNVELLGSADKLTEQALVAAIKAEYGRLSVVYPDQEPTARMVMGYFRLLDVILKTKQKA